MNETNQSYGFCPRGFNQIIVFSDEHDFKEIVAANPHMTAIMGADDHTRLEYPGVFIAGVVDGSHEDKQGSHHIATQK